MTYEFASYGDELGGHAMLDLMGRLNEQMVRSFGVRSDLLGGTISTASTPRQNPSTYNEMLRKLMDYMPVAPMWPGPSGLKIVEHKWLQDLQAPVRHHKWRSNQSEAYHRRVQKKRVKRFGTTESVFVVGVDHGDPRGDRSVTYMSASAMRALKEATRCPTI